MDGVIEIIFSTDECGARTVWAFVGMFVLLTAIGSLVLVLPVHSIWNAPAPEPQAEQLDRPIVCCLIGLAVALLCVFAAAFAAGISNTSLIAHPDRIEVRGCRYVRPFLTVFDRSEMTTTYRMKRHKNTVSHMLRLRQEGQRTIYLNLGDGDTDQQFAQIFPQAMKDYADELTREGRNVRFDIP